MQFLRARGLMPFLSISSTPKVNDGNTIYKSPLMETGLNFIQEDDDTILPSIDDLFENGGEEIFE